LLLGLASALTALGGCQQPPSGAFGSPLGAGAGIGGAIRSNDGGVTPTAGTGGVPTSTAGAGGSVAWQWSVACPDGHEPTDPVDYGRCAVAQALGEAQTTSNVTVVTAADPAAAPILPDAAPILDARPESYAVLAIAGTTWIVGRDPVGAMYGALEVAERLRLDGAAALPLAAALHGAPTVSIRAANLFWTLPDQGETAWWFYDDGFWHQYLDLLAHARIDLLDLHGMYDLNTTDFPNILPHVARSKSFPQIGVSTEESDRNLAMLNKVIGLAHARGIRVSVMSYLASTSVVGHGTEPLTDAQLSTYDRETAEDLATRAPGLSMFGFRIGETGKPATWYINSIVAGVKASGTGVMPYTRSWVSNKPDILALASAVGSGMVLEVKFNGEHLAAPYAIVGGSMSREASYSYQSYLNSPHPWTFVFQVRSGGTHRVFRQVSYERTRRAVLSLAISPAVAGFTLEPPHAYTPQRDFYHSQPEDQFSGWSFARDDLMYLLWGRLGYEPTTPEDTFRKIAARELGTDALWPAMQAASDIVPWIQTQHTCGPDSRDFAPELELGGDVSQWAGDPTKPMANCRTQGPFDTFAVAPPVEAAGDLVDGRATPRVSPIDVAAIVLDDAAAVDAALDASGIDPNSVGPLPRDVVRESRALADLGRYFGHKLRGATALAVYARTGVADWLTTARAETSTADDAWRTLAADTNYIKPFREHLRMLPLGVEPFHWSAELPGLAADGKALDAVAAEVAASPPPLSATLPDPNAWLTSPRGAGPGLANLTATPGSNGAGGWTVSARFATPLPSGATVDVLAKPFQSETDFSAVGATEAADGTWSATIPGSKSSGGLFAVEVHTPDGAWRYPDPLTTAPYVAVPP
jgi:hypothetical protein